jgi:hypothetical protein
MLSQNIRATRVHGTLEVDLEDGRTATLEVDLDVSGHPSAWGVEHMYAEPPELEWSAVPVRIIGTKYYVEVPSSIHRDVDHEFVLTIPVDG